MKKLYVLLLVTATVFSATQAETNSDLQFKKGDKLLGGSVGFSSLKETGSPDDLINRSVNVVPGIGFFTKPNRLIGLSLNYGYGESKRNSRLVNHGTSIGASFYKQYWSSLGKSFYFIVDSRLSGGYSYN